MSKPLTLEIGKNVPHEEPPLHAEAGPGLSQTTEAIAGAATHGGESLAEVYDAIKRHEETLRDLVVEIRLLYHNLAEKEKQRLETRREGITREVRQGFAHLIHGLEEKIAHLRKK